MSLLEGHGDVIMDRAGEGLVPSAPRFGRVMRRRRESVRGFAKVFQRLIGLDAKIKQYAEGEHFIESVESIGGTALLDRVWEGPENVPGHRRDPQSARLGESHECHQGSGLRRGSEGGAAATVCIDSLLARCTFPAAGTAVACGLSGGPDSAALVALARSAGLEVTAWHVDHGLRSSAGADAAAARALAARFDAGFELRRVQVDPGPNVEARGTRRPLRGAARRCAGRAYRR